MKVTATEAKNRFGHLSAQAKRGPVFVEKAGQLDTVIVSAEYYLALREQQDKVSRALRKKKFQSEFGGWIKAENEAFELRGIPGSDLRPW
jgi:prevent-host-death family protein